MLFRSQMLSNRASRQVNMANETYTVAHAQFGDRASLIDSGANGGVAGDDVLVLEYTSDVANVTGVGGANLSDLPICTVAGLL